MTDEELKKQSPPDTYDNTLRVIFEDCPRKFYFFLRKYDYATVPPYFTFGSAWHAVLGKWYELQAERFEERTKKSVQTRNYLIALGQGINFWENAATEGRRNDNLDNLKSLFTKYVELFPFEAWKIIGSELGWVWPLPAPPETLAGLLTKTEYYLAGSIDAYGEWPGYGKFILENKTSGMYLADNYINQWDFSTQVSQYIWYLGQLLGEPIFGCLMNMASKIPNSGKGKTTQFARCHEQRSEEQLKEFIDSFWLTIYKIEFCWKRWWWPMTTNPVNCVGGAGRSACLFRPVCLSGVPLARVEPLDFSGIVLRKETWEPWKRKGNERTEDDKAWVQYLD